MGYAWVGVRSVTLTPEDREMLAHPAVVGVILFARNFENVAQQTALCQSILAIRPTFWIGVDQEGGRVQRFRGPGFTDTPSMQHYGEAWQSQPADTERGLYQAIYQQSVELAVCGITTNFSPVLDLNLGVSAVIGARSFGSDPTQVARLGQIVLAAQTAAGIWGVGKHFPGHGAVAVDSHVGLPHDTRDALTVLADAAPFRALVPYLRGIMPAHVVYEAIDPDRPASCSRRWLRDILRAEWGYRGLVISDDMDMGGAVSQGSPIERAGLALEAGCDILLLCNDFSAIGSVLSAIPTPLDHYSAARVQHIVQNFASQQP
ncbi:MAG: hypothetical protein A3J38_01025 [Gammaproteobacteria bacterium RIFCSPHIGHO2_12_FULL_45_9]|nr:MAG: hypothetical protein A3J38_01025 [Gammaproteobacteria bacterium RIFCSPHIGHO2_12_FULL_45_9]